MTVMVIARHNGKQVTQFGRCVMMARQRVDEMSRICEKK